MKNNALNSESSTHQLSSTWSHPLVTRAAAVAENGRLEEALDILAGDKTSSSIVRNARGVCLLRMKRYEEALRLFRSLVLQAGCTWMRTDLPVFVRTNFSTALLLAGLPLGARDTLAEIQEKSHPSVIRLQNSLDAWTRQLTLLQRLSWKFGLAPNVPITLEFPPGDFSNVLPVRVPCAAENAVTATPSSQVA